MVTVFSVFSKLKAGTGELKKAKALYAQGIIAIVVNSIKYNLFLFGDDIKNFQLPMFNYQ